MTTTIEVKLTAHFSVERRERQALINQNGGDGNEIAVIYWDRGHKDGAEYHILTDNGIIIVENANSGRLITKKFARIGQVRQLEGKYDQLNKRIFTMRNVPKKVLNRCQYYQSYALNQR